MSNTIPMAAMKDAVRGAATVPELQEKGSVFGTHGVEFLGFEFRGYSGSIRVSPKNIAKFKDRVKEITRRKRGVSMTSRLRELRPYFNGWVGYFRLVRIRHRRFPFQEEYASRSQRTAPPERVLQPNANAAYFSHRDSGLVEHSVI